MWTIQSWYDTARRDAASDPIYYRNFANLYLKLYTDSMPGMSRAEIVSRLARCNAERLDAVPSLVSFPELRGMRELILAQRRGTSDGAGLTDDQQAAYFCANFYFHRHIASGRLQRERARCSTVYFPQSDHGPLFAANLDSGPDEPYTAPEWPMASEHLIIGGVSSGVFLDEESPEIFPAPVQQIVARYARSTDEAVEMFRRYNHFWGPCNLLIVDRDQRVAMIEKTACRMAVRFSPDGFGFVTAMAQEDGAMRAFVDGRRAASLVDRGLDPADCDDVPYWAMQLQRHNLMKELLDEARKKPTLEGLRAMLQFRSPTRGCCAVGGEPIRPGVRGSAPLEHTLRTYVTVLREKRALWWKRDEEKNIPSWLNPQPDVQYRDVLDW